MSKMKEYYLKVNLQEFDNKKTAFVLSGGVVKAASWHLGVALALSDLGFTFKCNSSTPSKNEISTFVGSSAGALIGSFLASGHHPSDLISAHVEGNKSKVLPITYKDLLSLRSNSQKPPKSNMYDPLEGLPFYIKKIISPFINFSGIFTTEGLKKYIINNILEGVTSYEELEADLFVVATQLDHSRKVIFSKYKYPSPYHDPTASYYVGHPVAETIAASMSVPPFYEPYQLYNSQTQEAEYYIDGEIRETLSTHVAIDNNCEVVISSWTHTPYHYHDEIGSLVNFGLPAICTQAIYLMIQKKIVESRARRAQAKDILDTVNRYLKTSNFPNEERDKLTSILERKLDYRKNLKMIDIYPKHNNYSTFFRNSFSLAPEKSSALVKSGYKRTMEIFKNREWENY